MSRKGGRLMSGGFFVWVSGSLMFGSRKVVKSTEYFVSSVGKWSLSVQ